MSTAVSYGIISSSAHGWTGRKYSRRGDPQFSAGFISATRTTFRRSDAGSYKRLIAIPSENPPGNHYEECAGTLFDELVRLAAIGPNPSGLCMCGCGRKTKIVVRKFRCTNTSVLIGRWLTTRTATAWTIDARISVELEEPDRCCDGARWY
jgi:hypothetical protein